jgi:RNA polymerase sigma-70 factor (ECF subfamily)
MIMPDQTARLFHRGSEKAFDHIFHSYYPALCFFASRLTGDMETGKDIASYAFIKTWEKRAKLHSIGAIRAYLYQVARNDAYKWLRQQQKKGVMQKQLQTVGASAEESQLELVIQSEFMSRLYTQMQQLPAGCRNVCNKLYVEGKTVAEVAAELQLSVSTVKTQKARGVIALRHQMAIGG